MNCQFCLYTFSYKLKNVVYCFTIKYMYNSLFYNTKIKINTCTLVHITCLYLYVTPD